MPYLPGMTFIIVMSFEWQPSIEWRYSRMFQISFHIEKHYFIINAEEECKQPAASRLIDTLIKQ